MHGDLHTGLVKTLRVLREPGNLKRFEAALIDTVIDKLEFAPATTSDAQAYQDHTLQLFAPQRHERPHAWGTLQVVSRLLLNGDWRLCDRVQHVCKQSSPEPCCKDFAHLVAKVKTWIPKLLRALRLKLVNKANWSDWHSSLFLVGYLCRCHQLFQQAFNRALRAMAAHDSALEPEAMEEGPQGDAHGAYEDVTQMAKIAFQWWDTRGAAEALFIFRAALFSQQKIMHTMLEKSGVALDMSNFVCRLEGGSCLVVGGALQSGPSFQQLLLFAALVLGGTAARPRACFPCSFWASLEIPQAERFPVT